MDVIVGLVTLLEDCKTVLLALALGGRARTQVTMTDTTAWARTLMKASIVIATRGPDEDKRASESIWDSGQKERILGIECPKSKKENSASTYPLSFFGRYISTPIPLSTRGNIRFKSSATISSGKDSDQGKWILTPPGQTFPPTSPDIKTKYNYSTLQSPKYRHNKLQE